MNLKKLLMERGMKLMSNPRVMKLMSNPKVMNLVMKGFQLRSQAQASFDENVRAFARTFHLATHREVKDLNATVQRLENQLRQMQAEKAAAKPAI